MSKEEMMNKLKAARETCIKDNPIPEDEEKGLMQKKIPVSQEGKCFVSCMFRQCGTMVDGKFNPEGAKQKAEIMFEDENKKKQAFEAIDQCAKEVTMDDMCETGAKIMECYMPKMPDM
ncbi:uncharacterized protein Obp50c isoform X2 [Anabrus simplex]